MEKLNNLKTGFLGLNKNQVESSFDDLENDNKKELHEIKQSTNNLITENNILQKNLESLECELSALRDNQDFIKYASTKAETDIIPLLAKSFEDKTINIIEIGKKEELEFDIKINQYKESLASAEEIYNDMVTSLEFDKKINEYKENLKSAEKIYNDMLASLEHDKKINQHKEIPKSTEKIYNNMVTSKEGVKVLNSLINFPQKKEIESLNIKAKANEINSEISFWDDEGIDEADDYSDNNYETAIDKFDELGVKEEEKENIQLSEVLCEKQVEEKQVEEKQVEEKQVEEKQVEEKQVEEEQVEEEQEKIEKNENTKNNKVSSSKIENIRSKYLIGKIVGEDLIDSAGSVIARKNSLITEDIIDKVNKEGKIAELIVNMLFTEASE